jgi:hypothetical protein
MFILVGWNIWRPKVNKRKFLTFEIITSSLNMKGGIYLLFVGIFVVIVIFIA